MMTPGFGPRFVPSTSARRFTFAEDDRTEVIQERLLRDRADTVRIAPPPTSARTLPMPAVAVMMVMVGMVLGALVAVLSLRGA